MCSVTQLIHVNTVHVPVPLSVVTRSVSVSARVAGLELAAIRKQVMKTKTIIKIGPRF